MIQEVTWELRKAVRLKAVPSGRVACGMILDNNLLRMLNNSVPSKFTYCLHVEPGITTLEICENILRRQSPALILLDRTQSIIIKKRLLNARRKMCPYLPLSLSSRSNLSLLEL